MRVEFLDEGIGAFERIRATFGLSTHLDPLQELSKGKTTTTPDRHTSEGIFFTSKTVERFELESGCLRWSVGNEVAGMTVARLEPPVIGTRVPVELDTRKPLASSGSSRSTSTTSSSREPGL